MRTKLSQLTAVLFSTIAALLPASAEYALFHETSDSIALANGTTLGTTATIEAVFVPLSTSYGSIFFEQVDAQEYKSLAITPTGANGAALAIPSIGSSLTAATAVALNTAHHLAFVRDGAEERLYLDGTLVASRAVTNANISDAANTVFPAAIGAGRYSTGTATDSSFLGALDSIRVSNVARYSGASITSPTGDMSTDANTLLLFNFDFADVTGNVVADLSGNGRNGTLGSTFSGATSPTLSATPNLSHYTSTWNGTTGNWSDTTKWSTPGAPGTFPNNGAATYDAVQNNGALTVDVPAGITLQKFSIGTGTLTATNNLTLNEVLTLSAPGSQVSNESLFTVLNGAGIISVAGGVNWSAASANAAGISEISGVNTALVNGRTQATDVINVTGGMNLHGPGVKSLNRRAMNHGDGVNPSTSTWSEGKFSFSNNAVFTNRTGAVFNNSFDGDLRNLTGTNFFINEGSFTKSAGTGFTDLNIVFDNKGTVNVNSGTLKLKNGGIHSGSFAIASGCGLDFSGGNHVLNGGATIGGMGIVLLSAGTLTTNVNTTFSNPLSLSASAPQVSGVGVTQTLNGPGIILVSGPMTWSAVYNQPTNSTGISDIVGTNTAVISGRTQSTDAINITGGLTLNGGGIKSVNNRALNHGDGVNPSLASWTAGNLAISNAGVFTNKAGATFDTNFDGLVEHRGGTASTFINEGTFTKSGGVGITTVGDNVMFINRGTVNVNTGTLSLKSGGSAHSGVATIAAGCSLKFLVGSHAWNTGAAFAGAGSVWLGDPTLSVNHATLTLNANVTLGNPLILSAPAPQVSSAGVTQTLNGLGTLVVSGPMTWSAVNNQNTNSTGISDIVGTNTAVINGRTQATDAINITGGLTLNGGGIKSINKRALNHGDGVNPSLASWTAGNLAISNAGVFTNKAGATFDTNFNGFVEHRGGTASTFINEGTFIKSGGTGNTTYHYQILFINSGTVDVRTGTFFVPGGYLQTGGELLLSGGGAAVDVNVTAFTIQGGVVRGGGTLQGPLAVSGGSVEPGIGSVTGLLTTTGNLSLTSASKLSFDIGGPTAGTQHDKLTEGGSAALSVSGVTLEVKLFNGYIPAVGETITVVEASTSAITGSFANVANGARLTLPGGLISCQVNYGAATAFPASNGNRKVILSHFATMPATLTLDDNQIVENAPAGTTVGLLGATDPNTNETFTFSLVSGAGSADNALFTIAGNELKVVNPLDFEASATRRIRLRVTNSRNAFMEQEFTIQVLDVPAPTALALSNNSIPENQQPNTMSVGTLTATDPDPEAAFTFSFASVAGDTDNARFNILGDSLRASESFDFETTPGPFNIRLRVTNGLGESFEESFAITVTDQGPSSLVLSPSIILEGQSTATLVGELSATIVPEGTAISSYELVTGEGPTDNALFIVDGSSIKTAAVLDFETAPAHSIRVKATDANGETFTQVIPITVGNTGITDITLSGTTVPENVPAGELIANLGAVLDPADPEAAFTFSIVSATPNDAVVITGGNQLVTSRPLLLSETPNLAVRLRAERLGESFEKDVTITVNANAGSLQVENPPGTAVTTFSLGDVVFGSGASASGSITLRNTGPGHVFNVGIRNPVAPLNDFVATSTGLAADDDLAPGESVTVDIEFTPLAFGNRNTSIVFESDNAPDLSLAVTGRGIGPEISVQQPAGAELVSGAVLNLGGQPVGVNFPDRTFVVRNLGTFSFLNPAGVALNSLSATMIGPDAEFFALNTQGFAASLPIFASSTFRVSFQPDALRTYSATLRITSSDLDENPFDIILTGEGVTPLMVAQSAYAKAQVSRIGTHMGRAVAVSGNTVVVGAPLSGDANLPVREEVYVFVKDGVTGVWTQQAMLTAPPATGIGTGRDFGSAVAISGDTLVVGNPTNAPVAVFQRTGNVWAFQATLIASNFGVDDRFGGAVAIEEDTVVVGASLEDSSATAIGGNQALNNSPDSGAAYVFTRSGSTWTQQAYIKASNTGANDQFGIAVEISGETLLVGASGEDGGLAGINPDQANNTRPDSGAAYIFTRTGGVWSQQAYIKASNPGEENRFGLDVALSGDVAVVGSENESSSALGVNGHHGSGVSTASGAAYIFRRDSDVWNQEAYLKGSNSNAGDRFGSAVAVSGNRVLVGARLEDRQSSGINPDASNSGSQDSGAAYLFERVGATWVQQSYIKASNTGPFDQFGFSAGLDGSVLVVGARFEDSNATGINDEGSNNSAVDSGAAYIFEITPPDIFVHDGPDTGNQKLADNQTQAVDFGPTPLGISVTRPFTIQNVRALPLTVSGITVPDGFVVTNVPAGPIPAQGSATFFVRLDELALGSSSGQVVISSNDGANPTFTFPVTGEVQALPAGSMDPRFGNGGVAKVDLGLNDLAYDMLIQPDGRLVVGGESMHTAGTGSVFALARLLEDGTLDAAFGNGGKVTTAPTGVEFASITDIAMQEDTIVVAGCRRESGWISSSMLPTFALARYLPDGTLDATFGSAGLVIDDDLTAGDFTGALVVNASGKLLLAGTRYRQVGGFNPYVRRYNQTGSVDTSFGVSGVRNLTTTGTVEALVLRSDGGLIAAGRSNTTIPDAKIAMWSVSSTGNFLGAVTYPVIAPTGYPTDTANSEYETASAIALQADGRLVLAGRREPSVNPGFEVASRGTGHGFITARSTTNPFAPDASFGGDGTVLEDIDPSNNREQAHSIAVQPDGKLLVAGQAGGKFALLRYLLNGTLDPEFGTDGKVVLDLGADGAAYKVLLDAEGDIYVAGHASNGTDQDFVVAKIIGSIVHEPAIVVRNGSGTSAPVVTNGQASAIDYGSRQISFPVSKSFRIENLGTAPLTITSITVPTGYQAFNNPGSVAAGTSHTLSIVLKATSLGSFSGPVTITTNDPTQGVFTFPVTGQVVANSPPVYSPLTISTVEGKPVSVSFEKLLSQVSDANGDAIQVVQFDPVSQDGASINQVEKALVFTQPVPLAGTDTFEVRFSDGAAQITGLVTVLVATDTAIPKNPPKQPVEVLAGGNVKLTFSGAPDTSYSIQQSPPFVSNFTQIGTSKTAKGKVVFTTTTPPPNNAEFRIRQISLIPAP